MHVTWWMEYAFHDGIPTKVDEPIIITFMRFDLSQCATEIQDPKIINIVQARCHENRLKVARHHYVTSFQRANMQSS